jgi:hypothetical protein
MCPLVLLYVCALVVIYSSDALAVLYMCPLVVLYVCALVVMYSSDAGALLARPLCVAYRYMA